MKKRKIIYENLQQTQNDIRLWQMMMMMMLIVLIIEMLNVQQSGDESFLGVESMKSFHHGTEAFRLKPVPLMASFEQLAQPTLVPFPCHPLEFPANWLPFCPIRVCFHFYERISAENINV